MESNRVVTSYGHCGTTIVAEYMPIEISDKIVPGKGYAKQEELDKLPDVRPANNFTAEQKLDIALLMAESIADVHNFVGGVIVHGDIHPVQWLKSPEGVLKLNDFNNAEILKFNTRTQKYCRTDRGSWGGMYRSPEEFEGNPIDEKIDVYSFGNNIYILITGLWPFYVNPSYSYAIAKVTKGVRPFVDERYMNRSYIEREMIRVMIKCWNHNSTNRPDISEVIHDLRNIKAEHEKVKGKSTETVK
jgi:serine/threonine protein kinase